MTKPTECALKGLLGADSTISPEQAKHVLDLLNGKPPQATILPTDEPDMVLSREAVASLIDKRVKSLFMPQRLMANAVPHKNDAF